MVKVRFLLLFLSISCALSAQTYYVQDPAYNSNASDMNPGTDINYPIATWQRAFDIAEAGDTVYFRGGTWYLGPGEKVTYDPANLAGTGIHGDSGTYDNHIVFMAYPGETPVLHGAHTTNYEELFEMWGTSYAELIGLTFRGKVQKEWNDFIRQVIIDRNGTIWINNCVSDSSGGYGWTINNWDTLYLINCDSYEHGNPLSDDPGNRPDGFAISSGGEDFDYGFVQGCRAWRCTDDGFEFSWSHDMYIDSCWSFCNGYLANGAGVGFKYQTGYMEDVENRISRHCISAYNRTWAYSFQNLKVNNRGPIQNFYNNLSYNDEGGFQSSTSTFFTDCKAGDTYLNFRNNVVYQASNKAINLVTCSYDMINTKWFASNNTWTWADNSYKYIENDTLNWTNDDEDGQWISLPDSATTLAALSASRKEGGWLPDIGNHYKLDPNSDLVDAGIDVGLFYTGDYPDLGPFESEIVPGTSNKYPVVKFISPVKSNSTLDLNENLIEVEAYDEDGSISRVELYYNDKDTIEIKTSPPWTFQWDSAVIGNYSFRAVAYDNQGAKATSERVGNVSVIPEGYNPLPPGEVLVFPNPNDGHFTFVLTDPVETKAEIRIVSPEGKIIYKGSMEQRETIKTFDLSGISQGFYFIFWIENDKYYSKKFIKL